GEFSHWVSCEESLLRAVAGSCQAPLDFGYYGIHKLADFLDLNSTFIAGLQPTRRAAGKANARGRSGCNDIAGLEREHARQIRDQTWDAENEIARVGFLHHFAVQGE